MAFRATFLAVVGITLLGHLLALAFEIAAAARFGTGADADALAFALVLVVMLTGEVGGWVSTLVVPLYVDARATGAAAAAAFLRRVLGAVVAGGGVVAVALAVGAPALIGVLAPALGERGVGVLRAFAPLVLLVPLATLFAAALHAHGRFLAASFRQVAWYGGGLAGVLLVAGVLGPVSAPLGMVAGTAVFALVLAALAHAVTRGAERPAGGPTLARLASLLLPLVLLSASAAVNVAVERALAARLPGGSLAALTYAYRLLQFPLMLFVVNATAMLLPALAGHAARGEQGAVATLGGRALRLTVVFAVPLAALAVALAEPLTRVLLERGAFTSVSTAATATALAWYAPGVVATALVQVLFRAYQALHALWPLAWTAGATIAVNVVMMPALTAALGFRGLALAASLAGFVGVGLMLLGLRARAPGLARALLTRSTAAVLAAGVVAAVAAWLARTVLAAPGPALLGGVTAGVAVYVGALAMLAPAEARAALAVLVPAASGRRA
jgi:putative peptidoglycan lipid II flippase